MIKLFSKLLFLAILSLVFPAVSFAQVVINEIMYDVSGTDAGREWVEIYNESSDNIDISGWKFLESVDASNHSFTVSDGNATLTAGGFAIIANDPTKFLIDWPSFSGNLLKASFSSLNNTGGTLTLKNGDGVVVDQATYTSSFGANGDDNSLQKSGSNWIAALPTPGAVNATTSNTPNSQNPPGEVLGSSSNSSSSNTASFGGSTNNVSSPSAQLEIIAGSDRTTSPGSPIWFQATVKKNTTSIGPELNWSFGDGNIGAGPLVSHTYKYPGDYIVVISARAGDIFSVSRLKVKVTESDISVSDKGEYLEISNNGNTEINLFNWKVENEGKGFIFQPNTIILPKSSIKFDKSLLNMKGLDNSQGTSIKNCLGEEVFAAAPIKEIDLEEASKNLDNIKKEFSLIQEKANNIDLISPANILSSVSVNEKVEMNMTNLPQATTSVENIIYEAPKQESFIAKLTNFIKRVFSK
jgi:hypothetical protein